MFPSCGLPQVEADKYVSGLCLFSFCYKVCLCRQSGQSLLGIFFIQFRVWSHIGQWVSCFCLMCYIVCVLSVCIVHVIYLCVHVNICVQTSQGQFGVKSDIFGARGVWGHAPPGNFGAKWCNLTHFEDISTPLSSSPAGYTYTRADRRSIGRAANWIYSPTVECVWFTNRCVRAWHDRWMRESHALSVRLVRSVCVWWCVWCVCQILFEWQLKVHVQCFVQSVHKLCRA